MISPHSSTSTARPFPSAPDASRYFPAQAIEEARQRLGRSIERGEGPVLVIGSAGLGKTMLLDVVATQFAETLRVVTLIGGQLCTRRALLKMILFQLDLAYREMDESELRLSLLAFLQPPNGRAQRLLLLVDEADALPPRLLEELRALTNIASTGQPLVRLVLAGTPTLEELFADPKLELFSQRIAARCYLSAFGREETFQYVRAQVASVGHDPATLFTSDGLEAIFAATDGAPRLINQLGDQLLWMYDESGNSPLDGKIVQQAWSELQQLPAPWNTKPSEARSDTIEFGELLSDELELEEVSLEEEDCEDGFLILDEDDHPASIPLHALPATAEKSRCCDTTDLESLDVTEHLLTQLRELDGNKADTDLSTTVEIAARNPFAETFDSEELVLDRYATFESQLLAEAPRVENRKDADFASQLKDLEFEAARPNFSVLDKPASLDVQQPSPEVLETANQSLPLSKKTPFVSDRVERSETPSELLVIEDQDAPRAAIVDGRRFRQLFSSLEQGESAFVG